MKSGQQQEYKTRVTVIMILFLTITPTMLSSAMIVGLESVSMKGATTFVMLTTYATNGPQEQKKLK